MAGTYELQDLHKMALKKSTAKSAKKHLREDIKGYHKLIEYFVHEAKEDRKLIKKLEKEADGHKKKSNSSKRG